MHETSIRVRFDEVDTMGVVHHPRYLVYFEVARTEYLRSLGLPYGEVMGEGTHLAVVEATARYLRPARYDDEIVVTTRCADCGGARLTLDYEVRRGAELIAVGSTRHGAVDAEGRAVRLPARLREAMTAAAEGNSRAGGTSKDR